MAKAMMRQRGIAQVARAAEEVERLLERQLRFADAGELFE